MTAKRKAPPMLRMVVKDALEEAQQLLWAAGALAQSAGLPHTKREYDAGLWKIADALQLLNQHKGENP